MSDLKSILTEPVAEEAAVEPVVEVAVEPIAESPAVEVVVEPVVEEAIQEPVQEEAADEPVVVEEVEIVQDEELAEMVTIGDLPVAEPADNPQPETPAAPVKKTSFWKIFLKTLMWLVIAAAVLCVAYITVGHLCPEWLDQFLYTPE